MSADLPSKIHSELGGLDADKQRQVLAYVRTLKETPQGMTGAELKKLAGTLSQADAKAIIDTIQAGCEQVDTNG